MQRAVTAHNICYYSRAICGLPDQATAPASRQKKNATDRRNNEASDKKLNSMSAQWLGAVLRHIRGNTRQLRAA